MITKIIKADGTEVVPAKNQYIWERGKYMELWQRDRKDPDLYHRVKRWYRRHILWIFYDKEPKAGKEQER